MAAPAAAAAAAKAAAKTGALRKLAPLVGVVLALVVGLPLLVIVGAVSYFGQAEKRLTESSCMTSVAAPNAQAGEIPDKLLAVYMAAGQKYDVDWRLLAGIGSVETKHGRNLAVSSAGAEGWMQFIPSTWEAYGVDANGDGKRDPWQMADAVHSAANYIKALLAQEDGDVRGAIFGYNHAGWYVDQVLEAARSYGYGSRSAQATTPQQALGQLDADAAAKIAQRRGGRVAFAVADASGQITAAYKPRQQFHSASLTKAMLLVAALQHRAGEDVGDGLRADLGPMIRDSDNPSANRVYARVGADAVRRVADQARMRDFELDSTPSQVYVLGDSLVSASDQARFFAQIVSLVPERHQGYARNLLASVSARWGIPSVAGGGGVVLSKAGWRDETDDDGWTIVQAAQVTTPTGAAGVAVLTDRNASESYGQETIVAVAGALLTQSGLDSLSSGCEGIGGGGPQAIRQAADRLEAMRVPYCYGGGHGSTPAKPSGGYWCLNEAGQRVSGSGMQGLDCSSSISWVLQRAGYDVPTMATPAWQQWAKPGRGQDGVTLWNKAYGGDAHIIIQVGDRFFGTSSFGHPSKGHGPAWFDEPPSAGYLAGFTPLHIPESAKPAATGDVAMVGDSLAVGTEQALADELDSMSVTTNAREGRSLAEGMDVIRSLGRQPGALAVSLFTNDDPDRVDRLADAVRDSTGYVAEGGCVVWATIVRPPVGGTTYERANTTLRSIGADNPQVIVVDWAAAVRRHPGWLALDGVHPTRAGYEARARLYAEGIRRCLG